MTDDRSNEGEGEDDPAGAGGLAAPGGGPRRVVSGKSVDDILDALESGPAGGDDAAATTQVPPEPAESDDAEPAGDDELEADAESDLEAAAEASADADETDPEADAGIDVRSAGSDADVDAAVAKLNATGSATGEPDASAEPSDSDRETNDHDPDPVFADDSSEAEPADGTDTGAVSGADVRAAERAEDRDPTPEIDEIDLSMDDLENAPTASSAPSATDSSTDPEPGDGPLAGRIDPNSSGADADHTADEPDDDADEDSTGLFGRVRGLFSR